jgi:hypothetical protein
MEINQKSKVLNISLWAAQIILAGMFILAGLMKTEFSGVAFTLIPALVAAFIGWGRWKKVPVPVKS